MITATCHNCGLEMVFEERRGPPPHEDRVSFRWRCPGEPHRMTRAGLMPGRRDDSGQRRAVRAPLESRHS